MKQNNILELHDLGKETFTICKNNGDGTCKVLLELPAEMEKQAKYFVDELETYINKVREENTKEIQRRVLDLIFDTRNSQEYVRGFMSCKTYIDGLLFQYLQSIKEQEK